MDKAINVMGKVGDALMFTSFALAGVALASLAGYFFYQAFAIGF